MGQLLPRIAPPTVTDLPGTNSPWVAVGFFDRGTLTDIDDAGRRVVARLGTHWPTLCFTDLGLEANGSDSLLHHVGIDHGVPNDAHSHFDGLNTTAVVTDASGSVGAVVTANARRRSLTVSSGYATPFRPVIDEVLAQAFRRNGGGNALLTQMGGGIRLPQDALGDTRLRRWGDDSIYPVFELLPDTKLDELLRHPHTVDDWNCRSSWPFPILPFYDSSIVSRLAGRAAGSEGRVAMTRALQLVYRVPLHDAQQAANAVTSAGVEPRAALLLLDQLNQSSSARQMGLQRFPNMAIAVCGPSTRSPLA